MIPFSFTDFEREAQAIVDDARAKAASVLQQAMAEAGRIREKARLDGVAAGLAEIAQRRDEICREAERDLVRLAVGIAERIVKTQIALGRPVAEANLKRAIELAAHRREWIVRVHPDDQERLAGQGFAVEGDGTVTPGGVILEARDVRIDLDVRTQLDEIEKGLLP